MSQVRALQEMVRSQPAGDSGSTVDSTEMRVVQRNLEATEAELQKRESRLAEVMQEKNKIEQNLFRSHQDLQDIKKSIDTRVASQCSSLKLELDTMKTDLNMSRQAKENLENEVKMLKKKVEEAHLNSSSTAAENMERKVAVVRKDYEGQLSALNEQIAIMQTALNDEEEKTNKMKEEMEVEVKLNREKEQRLEQRVESLSCELNESEDRTRTITKEKEEKEIELIESRSHVEAIIEASHVIQERQNEQEILLNQEKTSRVKAEQRSITLLTQKREWDESVTSRDMIIVTLQKKISELEEKQTDLTLELKTVTKRSASTIAEVRSEMRNIQETCIEQVEQAQAEKAAEAASFEKEKTRLTNEAISLQISFVKQREALDHEYDKEKRRIVSLNDRERNKLQTDFDKQKRQLEVEKDGVMTSANKEEKMMIKKLKQENDLELSIKLTEQKRQIEAIQQATIHQLQVEHVTRITQLQATAMNQIERLKTECLRRLDEQKKEFETKQTMMPSFGGFSTPMIDPFAGIPTGNSPIASPEDNDEEQGPIDPFAGFGNLDEFQSVTVPDVVVPVMPIVNVVDTAALDALHTENESLRKELETCKEENDQNQQLLMYKLEQIATLQTTTQDMEETIAGLTTEQEELKKKMEQMTAEQYAVKQKEIPKEMSKDSLKDSSKKLLKGKTEKLKSAPAKDDKLKKKSLFSRKKVETESSSDDKDDSEDSEEEAL